MNQEIKDRWINALESGAYRQGRGFLHTISVDDTESFCCLGVLSDLAYRDGVIDRQVIDGKNIGKKELYLYGAASVLSLADSVVRWAEIPTLNPFVEFNGETRELAYLNDYLKLSFVDIAIVIKEHL